MTGVHSHTLLSLTLAILQDVNVFCKPQDLLTIPLHIYLPVSETLKYNMDSFTRVFGGALRKVQLDFLFFEHVLHLFLFSGKKNTYGYLHYI